MFDNFKSASVPAKLVAIFVVGILLGLGLCGVGAGFGATSSGISKILLEAGAASFLLSVVGLGFSLIVLLVVGLSDKDR